MAQALKLLYLTLPRHSSVQVNNQPHYFLNTMPEQGGMKRTCEHLRKKQTASLFLSESPPFRKWVKCRVSHSALCVQPFQSPEHGGGMAPSETCGHEGNRKEVKQPQLIIYMVLANAGLSLAHHSHYPLV